MKRRAAAAVLVLAVALLVPHAARAQTATAPGTTSVTLSSQTPWVDPVKTSVFALRVAIASPVAATDMRVLVNVYGRLGNRSEFTRTLSNTWVGYEIAHPIDATLDSLHPDAQGVIEVDIPVTNVYRAGQNNLLHLANSGVYPVSVELRPARGGKALARMVTTMLYTASPISGPALYVSWVMPVHAAPPDPKGRDVRPPVAPLVDALASHPAVPVALKVTPDTLSALDRTDPATVSALGRSLTGREVLSATWVPMSLPAMLQAGMGDQASLSLAHGTDRLRTDLGTQVADRAWVEDGPINQDALTFLRGAQFDRVVLPEADLDPNPLRFTLAQPFVVAGSNRTTIRAAVADAGLQSHFVTEGDPVLAAHQLLADLFQIYGDAPSNTRGVIVATPRTWVPSAAFLDAWLTGLQSSPVLQAISLDSFFDVVPPVTGRDGQPLTRQVVTDPAAVRADSNALAADAQRQARAQLDALATALPDNSAVYSRLERLLFEVPSTDLTALTRRTLLDGLGAGVLNETRLIAIAGPRTITLTARTGRLPLNVVSQSDEPIRVLLRVESDKLELPGAGSTGRATFQEELHKGNNPLDLSVKARTPGAFTVKLTVMTPGGSLVLTQTRLTVQSTALSGVGVVLSVGAALFLLVWWGRHAWRAGRGSHSRRRGT